MTQVMRDQLEALTPAPPLDAPMVIATLSCPQPDTTVCRVTGSVDLGTAPALVDRIIEAVHDGQPHVVIDLSAVALLDSIGLEAVFEALDQHDIAGHLAVVADSRSAAVNSPDISALDEVLDIHYDLASALRACSRASISHGGRHRATATN
jgi:anti-sigma B factor antagonist